METMLLEILTQPAWVVYVVVGLVVLLESGAFVGVVLPGETAALLAGVAAATGGANLAVTATVVAASAISGDLVGYEIGRRMGPRLLGHRLLRRHSARLDGVRAALERHGTVAVVLGRWTAFVRTVMPAVAGAAGMRRGTFARAAVVSGSTWGAASVMAGYLVGAAYPQVAETLGDGALVAVGLLAAIVTVRHLLRRMRRRHAATTPAPVAGPVLVV